MTHGANKVWNVKAGATVRPGETIGADAVRVTGTGGSDQSILRAVGERLESHDGLLSKTGLSDFERAEFEGLWPFAPVTLKSALAADGSADWAEDIGASPSA